ncbi:MAG: type II toxin-antitoxin system HipA family toxin [Treponema sp.]|jgi:serine/threonine-protein kinase HipA|nr:type II toxin-antitoxin system HipA family toxin [Treponema sp.]
MSTLAEVRLWGGVIGSVFLGDETTASFEYERSFRQSGIQVAPLTMPLGETIYRFPQLPLESFHGLPGLLADSLPDKFGNALINAWLAGEGRSPDSFNAVERLCYTGKRGMGALEFYPLIDQGFTQARKLEIGRLVELASRVLQHRENFELLWEGNSPQDEKSAEQILQVGTSAGGARAKAVIAWNPQTNEIRSGQIEAGAGFEYWLMKFDGVQGNRDKELADAQGYTNIEYAYYLMARAAGITINECRLFPEQGRSHFMTKRFDRTGAGEKIHMQTLGALAHYDYNEAGSHSYEEVFPIIRALDMPVEDTEQFFRRMVFNLCARNQDDHVKNISFLMDRRGRWRLSPAYDITYGYQKDGVWTGQHQMSVNGKRDNFDTEDIIQCGKTAGLVRGRALELIGEVENALHDWPNFAAQGQVDEERIRQIKGQFRKFL